MRFLADESCDFCVVRALRKAGHDVLAVAEATAQMPDEQVIATAADGLRIVLTEDKDFGRLVYAEHAKTGGVIFIRYPSRYRSSLADHVRLLVEQRGDSLTGHFVVMAPGRIRIGAPPP